MGSRSRSAITGAAVLLFLLRSGIGETLARERVTRVVVLPVENLSAASIPVDDIRQFLIDRLASQGLTVLGDDSLGAFMARHRVRYAAGIDTETAEALRQETGVDAALFASVELCSDAVPPKVALIVRLVSVTGVPTVIWADAAGLAGDDAPGFFELGLVTNYQTLQTKALARLANSLLAFIKGGVLRGDAKRASKFRPKSAYRAVAFEPGKPRAIAVVPFFNLSDRRNAGEILALLFIRHLADFEEFQVVDTGVVRRRLLDARIIMDGGLSITDAETLAALADADVVLGGRVTRYEDYEGAGGTPRVEFSTVMIDRASRKVVWSSDSYNEGRDGVGFFERGTSRTAHAMATQMVRFIAELIVAPRR